MIPILAAVANIVPWIAKYYSAGSKVIETVGGAVSATVKAVGGNDDFHTALANITGNGEKVAQLNLELAKLQEDWDKAYLDDVANARQMAIELARTGQKEWTKPALAAAAYVLVLSLSAFVVFVPNLSEFVKSVILLLLGRSLGWIDSVYQFDFGTTRQNKAKDATIQQLTSNGNGNGNGH